MLQFSGLLNHKHQKECRLLELREFVRTRRLDPQGAVVEEGLERGHIPRVAHAV